MIKKEKRNTPGLSVIIIAKNEDKMIPDCLESIKWADEIVLVDSGSTDKTVSIAKKYNARVIEHNSGSFSDWRNAGLKAAKGKWILYIDADERTTSELQSEIQSIIKSKESSVVNKGFQRITDGSSQIFAYAVPRRNFILGREFKHSDQWPDYQMRFFKKDKLKGYRNDLHELAEFEGQQGNLQAPLIHLKHDNLSGMVKKTNKWSELEAKMLYESGHPRMVWWRFIRIMLTELWIRLIKQGGMRDGMEGIIYSIYQMWSKFITYGKLWEMQIGKDTK
jgi:glycosyltransferase involved in cell wall biosynthesis